MCVQCAYNVRTPFVVMCVQCAYNVRTPFVVQKDIRLDTRLVLRCDAEALARWKAEADRSGRPLAGWARWVLDRASGCATVDVAPISIEDRAPVARLIRPARLDGVRPLDRQQVTPLFKPQPKAKQKP